MIVKKGSWVLNVGWKKQFEDITLDSQKYRQRISQLIMKLMDRMIDNSNRLEVTGAIAYKYHTQDILIYVFFFNLYK